MVFTGLVQMIPDDNELMLMKMGLIDPKDHPASGSNPILEGPVQRKSNMNMKVTSFEISKRLDELGFECESHCGWWMYPKNESINKAWNFHHYVSDQIYKECKLDPHSADIEHWEYKAYDCWDLLMWLRQLRKGYDYEMLELEVDAKGFEFFKLQSHYETKEWISHEEPQNALGLAVIKILEESSNGMDNRSFR